MLNKFNNKVSKLCTFYLLAMIIISMIKNNLFTTLFILSKSRSTYLIVFSIIIIFSIFSVFNSFKIKTSDFFSKFSKTLKNLLLGILLLSLLSNLLISKGLYFNGFIRFIIIIVGSFSTIFLLIFLISSNTLIWKNVIHKKIPNILTSTFLILFTLLYSLLLLIGTLLSIPEEINTTYNNEKYIIGVDGFLVARDKCTFTYYKAKYFFLMESLDKSDVPKEILAENNDYY